MTPLRDAACSNDGVWERADAERAVFFIQEFCRHVKGPLAGEALRLAPWQRDLVERLFGHKRPDGRRRHRYVWIEVPRKGGKSTFLAALGLYMLMVDPEPGAEVVIAAVSGEQAGIGFNIAREMVLGDPDLSAVCKVYRSRIVYKDAHLRAISSRHEAIHGGNISCLLLDDVHLQPTRDMHDALITSMAARTQPLTVYATTAGSEHASLAWELHEYASRVAGGAVEDPSWLVSMFGATTEDDWTDRNVWRKAHPGIGVTVTEEFIEQECRRAQNTPGFIGTFRQLYLNIWGQDRARWLDMEKWDRCGDEAIDPVALIGRECRAGLDLSTTTDLTALVLVFPDADGGCTVLAHAFCPEEAIFERQRRDRVDYDAWRRQGYLTATEGNSVDHGAIRQRILEVCRTYRVRELAYDRWNSSMLISQLVADGISCVPVAQSNGAMNPPARELERLLAEGTLRHGGNPVLRWCAGNVVAHADTSGDIRPSKSKSIERIDLIVALLMGLSRQLIADRGRPGRGAGDYSGGRTADSRNVEPSDDAGCRYHGPRP